MRLLAVGQKRDTIHVRRGPAMRASAVHSITYVLIRCANGAAGWGTLYQGSTSEHLARGNNVFIDAEFGSGSRKWFFFRFVF
jgi:hypothetical protein